MKIGIAGPASLRLLAERLEDASALPAGYEFPHTAFLAKELLDRGHHVDLFTLDSTIKAPRTYRGENLSIHIGRYRERHRARDFFAQERADLVAAMHDAECDVIHAHWTYEFAIAALASERPCLITAHDWAPAVFRTMPGAYRLSRLMMNQWTMWRCQHMTVVSPYIQRKVRRATGENHPLIPNGLPDSSFADVRRELNQNSPVLISVNNGFGRRKNVQRLLEAFSQIRLRRPRARLRLVGVDYQPGGPAARWASHFQLGNGVEFLGRRGHDEVLALMQESDILVHPSLEESFGITLIEAMSQRTPVIGGERSGAVPWVLAGGKAGALVNVTDSAEIADKVLQVLNDGRAWSIMSECAYVHAFMHFRMSSVAAKYVQQYERVVDAAKMGTRSSEGA